MTRPPLVVPMPGKLAKLSALPAHDRWLLVLAATALPLIAVSLRRWRLERVVSTLAKLAGQRHPDVDPGRASARAQRTQQLVAWAAGHGIHGGNCLSRSVTLWWLLRRQGIHGDLRIGVRKDGDGLQAHAWVECGGRVLNDRADVSERMVPFASPIVPRGLTFR